LGVFLALGTLVFAGAVVVWTVSGAGHKAAPEPDESAPDPYAGARGHAGRREWTEATQEYAQALKEQEPADGHFWFEYAALMQLTGDQAGYRKACARMVQVCGKSPWLRPYHVARACTLAADCGQDPAKLQDLAKDELRQHRGEFWSLTEQAALQYRAGNAKEAVPLLRQSLKADPQPGRAVINWLWLALVEQRLGRPEEARRWLERAAGWLDGLHDGWSAELEESDGMHLHNWLEAHVLRREAEAALTGPKAPAKP
jgi:tetratricopeptide (TPR) repeat protein